MGNTNQKAEEERIIREYLEKKRMEKESDEIMQAMREAVFFNRLCTTRGNGSTDTRMVMK